jgi:hypothetical protein
MAQQTAVEWLEKKIEEKGFQCQTEWQSGYQSALNEVIFFLEQAKEMEKEQRIKDYNAGYIDAQCNHINDAENYVNEQEYLNNKL